MREDGKLDYLELPAASLPETKEFYSRAFGWTFVDYGPTYTEFSDGRLTGGFTTGEPVRPGGPLIILYADDLDDTQRRLEAVGAVITRATFSFPGGSRFHFTDLDGYELAVWTAQP